MRLLTQSFSLLLIGCLVLPFAGTRLWMEYAREEVREQVKESILEGIPGDELVSFHFSKEEAELLDWEHEKEFEYHGEMYDVVERVETSDSLHLLCFWDQEESHIKQQIRYLTQLLWQGDPLNKESQTRLLDFQKTLICQSISLDDKGTSWLALSSAYKRCLIPDTRYNAPPFPPPQLIA